MVLVYDCPPVFGKIGEKTEITTGEDFLIKALADYKFLVGISFFYCRDC